MNNTELKEYLHGHDEKVLTSMYANIVQNPKMRESNEEYLDLVSDVIMEKREKVNNILNNNNTDNESTNSRQK